MKIKKKKYIKNCNLTIPEIQTFLHNKMLSMDNIYNNDNKIYI